MHVVYCTLLCTLQLQSKGREDKHKEFVPPSPFYMRPTGLTIFMRHKLGSPVLQKAGRIPFTAITVDAVPKPSGKQVAFSYASLS